MTRAEVNPGICGLRGTIVAIADGQGKVKVDIESECTYIQELADKIKELDPYGEWDSFFNSSAYQAANVCFSHTDCVMPAAILKAVNVEAGLALPADVTIKISKE